MRVSTVNKINRIPMMIGCAILFVLGALFLFLSFTVLIPNAKTPEGYVDVEATIVEIKEEPTIDTNGTTSYEYTTYIDYSYGDATFTHVEYGSYSSSMKVNDKVIIHVNPQDPSEFRGDSSIFYVFPIFSGIFTLIGLFGFVYNYKKLQELKRSND